MSGLVAADPRPIYLYRHRSSGQVEDVIITLVPDGTATIAAQGVTLEYNIAEWDAFTKGVADGQFDCSA